MPQDAGNTSGGITLPNGITANTAIAATKITTGATKNRALSTWPGVNSALKRNFTPSASGWPKPEQADLRQRDSHPVRPQPILHPGRDPALQEHQIGRGGHQPGDRAGRSSISGSRNDG